MANIINQFGQIKVGFRSTQVVNSIDTDAQAFITAANITDSTQQSAINTLVTQLKTYGIWTKLKAVYPFVGGTASSHKFNLKDPRDLDAAYRLVFNGGWTHSSTGALPNGTTAAADTKLIPTSALINNNTHVSFYSRTQNTSVNGVNIGCYDFTTEIALFQYYNGNSSKGVSMYEYPTNATYVNNTNTLGFQIGSRTSSTSLKLYFNNSLLNTNTTNNVKSQPTISISIGASTRPVGFNQYAPHESAFASIGDGLTDAEAANFYTAVQTFQTTLGRQVGVPIVADSDAQAFLNAAVITNQTQANAINTLVTSLKSANIWTKMKAIYPFVGGTASSHKFNLKDPRDVDAAYRLVFAGGWTHSSTGALPNGTTAYANTYLNPYVVFGNNQGLHPANSTHQLVHVSKYSRTNSITTAGKAEGVYSHSGNQARFMFYAWDTVNVPNGVAYLNGWGYYKTYSSVTLGNRSDGFFVINRDGYTSLKSFRNNTLISTNNTDIRDYNEVGLQLNLNANQFFFIGARNDAYDLNLRPYAYNNYETSFQSIGTSLTDAEATAFYNAVQAYQTTLGRQV